MRRLNKARVALKHNVTLPSQLDIEAFRASTIAFFTDNTSIVCEKALEDISLIELVIPESSRSRLKAAQDRMVRGETLTALDEVSIAFLEMITDY